MTVKDVISHLEELAPLATAEDFDNVGLLVGQKQTKVTGVLVTLDTLETVVDEAIKNNCNLIVSFHPIIFKGLKSLTGKNYVERTVLKAIKNDIAIYAVHTALDNSFNGVNAMMCKQLGLTNREILIPQTSSIKKLVTYVPKSSADTVREALFNAGAGSIGNYDHCSFNVSGIGTFNGNEDSNPVVGIKGKTHKEEEIQIGITFKKHIQQAVLQALFSSHPYEEVAFEITTLENQNQKMGMGMIGEFNEAMSETDFLETLKSTFNCCVVRHSNTLGKPIKKVAVLGGSGAFAIGAAKGKQADAYVTADLKYHDFYQAEDHILLADIGHYESEQFTKELLHSYITKKFTNFATVLSKTNTNPIKYL
jgi:dinuclear metal center YbgI/SA1388 family protein